MAWKPYLSGEVIILNKSTLNKLNLLKFILHKST